MSGTREGPVDVVVSLDGLSALSVEELRAQGRDSGNPFHRALYFTVRATPRRPPTGLVVSVDTYLVRHLEDVAERLHWSMDQLLTQVALSAIARALDEGGLPVSTGRDAPSINADREAQSFLGQPRPAPFEDDEVLAYMALKLYWGWRFGMSTVAFGQADSRRLGTTSEEFARLGLAGDGRYWTRSDSAALDFTPTARLLEDVPAGRFPGMSQPLLPGVLERLRAPRYESARQHLEKAIAFHDGESPDLANAVKEATAAVEALALRVLGMQSGTLGDCVKELRERGLLSRPLDKAIEALWGYSNEQPGVRHGKADPGTVQPAEGSYAVNLAVSAIHFLLEKDR